MEIVITHHPERTSTVYDVMGQTARKRKAAFINKTYVIDSLLFIALRQ